MIWITAVLLSVFCLVLLERLRWQALRLKQLGQVVEGYHRHDNFMDDLTGISSTKALQPILKERIFAAYAAHAPVSFLLADVDGFKQINAAYGLQTGDKVLKTIALLLKSELRGCDRIIRYRIGDEFLIVAYNTGANEAAWALAERLREKIQGVNWKKYGLQPENRLTVSIGVSQLTAYHQVAIDRVLQEAEDALLRAKKQKNAVCLYERADKSSQLGNTA